MSRPAKEELRPVAERLREVARSIGTQAEAAAVIGVSPRQMRLYLSAQSEPSVESLATLALASGTSLEWLLSGREPQRVGTGDSTPPVVRPRPEQVLQAIADSPTALRRMHPLATEDPRRLGEVAEAYKASARTFVPTPPAVLVARVHVATKSCAELGVPEAHRASVVADLLVLLESAETQEEEAAVLTSFARSWRASTEVAGAVAGTFNSSGTRAMRIVGAALKAHALAATALDSILREDLRGELPVVAVKRAAEPSDGRKKR